MNMTEPVSFRHGSSLTTPHCGFLVMQIFVLLKQIQERRRTTKGGGYPSRYQLASSSSSLSASVQSEFPTEESSNKLTQFVPRPKEPPLLVPPTPLSRASDGRWLSGRVSWKVPAQYGVGWDTSGPVNAWDDTNPSDASVATYTQGWMWIGTDRNGVQEKELC